MIDLDNIIDHIAKGSSMYAKITIENLIESTRILAQPALFGRVFYEYDNENFKELIRGNYRVIYKKEAANI